MDFGHSVKVWCSCCIMGVDIVLWHCENMWSSCRFLVLFLLGVVFLYVHDCCYGCGTMLTLMGREERSRVNGQ